MQNILVTDEPERWQFLAPLTPIISATDYLSDRQYHQNESIRLINLCKSYNYQTIGYYVSLLAQARDHKAIPSVLNIQDVLNTGLCKHISEDIDEEIQQTLQSIPEDELALNVYFGQTIEKKYHLLAKKLHDLFPLPIIRFTLEKKKQLWAIKKLTILAIKDILAEHSDFMEQAAKNYLSKKRFHQWRKKQRFHNLAILIDPSESNPPSDKKALELFVNSGESIGLNVDLIDKNDKSIAEYDALFIRATTAVDHFTYRFARRATQENLVVIDDPQSIVKCSNKVYFAELMRSHQVLTPDTRFLSKYDNQLPVIEYPCVLKKPDGAFSQGVIKVDDEQSLKHYLKQFFKTSDLVLIQPFIPTPFDWRIGVLDNKPLFASRYYMAKGHWQIYNWNAPNDLMGEDDSVSLNEVPEGVIKTALKATRLIGDSLYGVDIKSYKNKHYVIEINDNPSIDHGVEDRLLGESLYQEIMSVFLQRIRRKHGYE
jgi:glutathione synthase/RimK-type ligase-like ATP-grasp enzyme